MILPIMDYGDIFYHNKNSSLLNKSRLYKMFKCIRIISRLPRLTNTSEEEHKLGLPLRSLHILQFAKPLC